MSRNKMELLQECNDTAIKVLNGSWEKWLDEGRERIAFQYINIDNFDYHIGELRSKIKNMIFKDDEGI